MATAAPASCTPVRLPVLSTSSRTGPRKTPMNSRATIWEHFRRSATAGAVESMPSPLLLVTRTLVLCRHLVAIALFQLHARTFAGFCHPAFVRLLAEHQFCHMDRTLSQDLVSCKCSHHNI